VYLSADTDAITVGKFSPSVLTALATSRTASIVALILLSILFLSWRTVYVVHIPAMTIAMIAIDGNVK